jgi:hypothetical protein
LSVHRQSVGLIRIEERERESKAPYWREAEAVSPQTLDPICQAIYECVEQKYWLQWVRKSQFWTGKKLLKNRPL